MEYITSSFENSPDGLTAKDAYTRQLAAQGYRIISEQIEQGHISGQEQCCWALVCLPFIFLARRTPAVIVVTYGREVTSTIAQVTSRVKCSACGKEQVGGKFCEGCGTSLVGLSPIPGGSKACPMCAEHIKLAAKQCRFCGHRYESSEVEAAVQEAKAEFESRLKATDQSVNDFEKEKPVHEAETLCAWELGELRADGHTIEIATTEQDEVMFRVNSEIVITPAELHELAEGICSYQELKAKHHK